jgi:hypothetical protein
MLNQLARGRGGYQGAGANVRRWDPNAFTGPDDPSNYGRAGGLTWNSGVPSGALTNGTGGAGYLENDPRYFSRQMLAGQDGTTQERWNPNDAWKRAHIRGGDGFSQVRDVNMLNDQNAVEWDDEFGWMTNNKNVKSNDDWIQKMMPLFAAAGLGGPALFHALGIGGTGAGVATEAGGGGYGMGLEGLQAGGAGAGAGQSLGGGLAAGAGGGAAGGLGGLLGGLGKLGTGGLSMLAKLLGGGSGGSGAGGGGLGGGGVNDLLKLLLSGAGTHYGNKQNKNYEGDINRMIDIGTAGVTNDHRKGARDMVTGVYDGSISGEEVFNRVPGLRAISERTGNDIERKWSAKGEAGVNDPHQMREWTQFNNELTTKAWNSEMDRASRIGGFDFNPAVAAGMGMNAYSQLDYNQRMNNNDMFDALSRFLGGGGGGSNGGGIWDIFRGAFDDEGIAFPGDGGSFDFGLGEDSGEDYRPGEESDWFPSFWGEEDY